MSHLDPSPGRRIVAKWMVALFSAHLVTLGVLGLVFGLTFAHPFRLRRIVEGEQAFYASIGYVAAGGLILWLTHRFENDD